MSEATKYHMLKMRADLTKKFEDGFYSKCAFIEPNKNYESRYINEDSPEEQLQIMVTDAETGKTEWKNAYSIDFDDGGGQLQAGITAR